MSNDPWRNHHQALTWKAFSDFNPLHAKSDNKKIHAFPRIFHGNDSGIALSSLLWIRLVHRTQRDSSPASVGHQAGCAAPEEERYSVNIVHAEELTIDYPTYSVGEPERH